MITNKKLGQNMFASKGFRQGNGKQNFLHYQIDDDSWCIYPKECYTCKNCNNECKWNSKNCKFCGKGTGRSDDKRYMKDPSQRAPRQIIIEDKFENFKNVKGLELISTLDIEKNFKNLQNKISKNKIELFFDSSKTENSNIKTTLDQHIDPSFPQTIQKLRESTLIQMKESLPTHLKESIQKGYWIKFKELRGKLG
jgi:hypothetical protein